MADSAKHLSPTMAPAPPVELVIRHDAPIVPAPLVPEAPEIVTLRSVQSRPTRTW